MVVLPSGSVVEVRRFSLSKVLAMAPPRLLDERGRPTFGLNFYAVNKKGETGAASFFPSRYAVHDGREAAIWDTAYLYQRGQG